MQKEMKSKFLQKVQKCKLILNVITIKIIIYYVLRKTWWKKEHLLIL